MKRPLGLTGKEGMRNQGNKCPSFPAVADRAHPRQRLGFVTSPLCDTSWKEQMGPILLLNLHAPEVLVGFAESWRAVGHWDRGSELEDEDVVL